MKGISGRKSARPPLLTAPYHDVERRLEQSDANGPRPTRENMLMVHFVPSSCLRAALECFEFAREGVLQPVPQPEQPDGMHGLITSAGSRRGRF